MWGKGIYFAVNAKYSCEFYSYKVVDKPNTFKVFLADVLLGKHKEIPYDSNVTPQLKCAPDHYDSVKGNTRGSDVYMVYANVKTYPRYLIEFT